MATIIRKIITSPNTYKPVGSYSQAVLVDQTLYVSGILGIDKDTSALVDGGAGPETRKALVNLGHILAVANIQYENVVKTTIMLKDLADFPTVNAVYQEFFKKNYPARSTYQAAKLELGAAVEIEVIALVGDMKTVSS